MRRLIPLLLVCATAAPAIADGVYFSESFGGRQVKDELGDKMDGALRVRIAIGYRRRAWAVEGWVAGDLGFMVQTGFKPDADGRTRFDNETALLMYGLDVKYLKPISPHLELYLRGSMGYGVLDSFDYGGRGLGVGAGVQLKGKVPAVGLLFWPLFFCGCGPKITGAVFVDDGFDFYRLHPGGKLEATPAIDAQLSHLTIGFAAGTDF